MPLRPIPAALAAALIASACVATPDAPEAGSGGDLSGGGPVAFEIVGEEGRHPTIRVPWSTASAMGVSQPTIATPDLVDRLEAACAESNRAIACRRAVRACRERPCTIVPLIR